MTVYKTFMKDVGKYFKERWQEIKQVYNYKKLVVGLTILAALFPSVTCKSKLEIIEDEMKGRKIMTTEAANQLKKYGYRVVDSKGEPYDLNYDGKKRLIYPDWFVEDPETGNPCYLLGEFDSPNDEFTSAERRAAEAYNSTPGTPVGKIVLGDPGTEEDIKEQVRKQLWAWGF